MWLNAPTNLMSVASFNRDGLRNVDILYIINVYSLLYTEITLHLKKKWHILFEAKITFCDLSPVIGLAGAHP